MRRHQGSPAPRTSGHTTRTTPASRQATKPSHISDFAPCDAEFNSLLGHRAPLIGRAAIARAVMAARASCPRAIALSTQHGCGRRQRSVAPAFSQRVSAGSH